MSQAQSINGETDLRDEVARRLGELDAANASIAKLQKLAGDLQLVVNVMRERLLELEVEVINARCEARARSEE